MASIIRMPEVLSGATEAAIQTWLVAEGDTVSVGQALAEIETDKAVVEYNSEVDGVILRLLVTEGQSASVGAPIGVVSEVGESDADVDAILRGESAELVVANGDDSPAEAITSTSAETGERLFVSPLVRRLAREQDLDLQNIVGSGPHGRIVRRDLEAPAAIPAAQVPPTIPFVAMDAPAVSRTAAPPLVVSAPPANVDFTDIPHTSMRRAIARRLTESKSSIPHFYLTADCRVDRLLALRAEINADSPRKISVNDFIIKAVAAALIDVPEANVIWAEAATRRYNRVDLSVAVATDGGLFTPVLRGVESLSLSAISAEVADLARRARAGKIKQRDLEGGSFAVSNLGMYGVDQFSAILNPPQSGILAVGAAKPRAVVVDGQLAVASVMTVTLSADHRAVDGAVAAQLLAAFVRRIENPVSMLA